MHTWTVRWIVLVALCAGLPAWGQADDAIETTYKSLEPIPGSDRRILHTGDRQTYQVTAEVYEANRALFFTIKRGDPIVISVGSGSMLVAISKRASGEDPGAGGVDEQAAAFRAQLQGLARGDIVEVDGNVYRLLNAGDAEVTLSLKVPGSDPPRYQGSRRLAYDRIRFVNVLETKQPADEDSTEDDSGINDLISREGVGSGDTVIVRMLPGAGPGAVQGRVVAMSRTKLRVAVWRGAGYDRLIDLTRKDVRAIERTELQGRRNLPLGGLTVAWRETRYVERRAGKTEFRVVVQHDAPGKVLVGLWIRPLDANGDPAPTGGSAVRPMFPGMPRTVQLAGGDIEATLGFSDEGLSEIDSSGPEAELLLVEALADASDDDTLRALLLAATQSGNPRLLAYAATRALLDPPGSSGATLAREAVAKVSEAAASWADEQLAREDDQLRITRIADYELQAAVLPQNVRAIEFRRRLLGFYADLEGALTPGRAQRLFDYALRDSSMVEPLATSFAADPAVALPVLVETYLDTTLTQDRKHQARDVIVAMGTDGVDALSAELVRRGIDPRPLAEAVGKRQPLPDQVELGLRLAKLDAVEGVVADARAAFDDDRLEEAYQQLQPVLGQFPRHPAGNALLEDLRLPLARLYLSTRRRSDAMRLLRDAVGQEAKARLAALYIEAATEELTGVVVRDEPHVAAQNTGLLDKGQSLPGRRVDSDWVEVAFSAERKGFVRSVCVDEAGGSFTVRVVFLPVPAFEELLNSAKELAPELAPQCETLLGRRYLQQAVQSYEDGEYGIALALFAKARERIDEDERLSLERIAWFYANWWLFAGIGMLLAISIGVYFLANYLRRRRKIDISKDAPLEIRTESGRVVKPTKRQQPVGGGGKAKWTSPAFLAQVLVAAVLGGVILHQAWKLWRAF